MTEQQGNSDTGKARIDESATAAQSGLKAADSAARHLPSHLRLWVVAALGLVADLWSKHWAFTQLDPNPDNAMVVIHHVMRFQRSLNPGALFGLGKGMTPVFVAASILALGFVLFLFIHSDRRRRSLHIALALVLAGALGNLYDRVFAQADVVKFTQNSTEVTLVGRIIESSKTDRGVAIGSWPGGQNPRFIPSQWQPVISRQGVVRDFIKMEPHIAIGQWSIDIWPWVFNIADAWLVVGVAILMVNFWHERRAERGGGSDPPSPAST